MTAFQKAAVLLLAAGLLGCAWMLRYSVVIGARGDFSPPAYLIDRWTGTVYFLRGAAKDELFVPQKQ